MKFTRLDLSDVILVDLEPIGDDRGFFARMFCCDEFKEHGISTEVVQCNNTLTKLQGTIRGIHFQRPPKAETKFVRCIKGKILDVAVDLRDGSETFGHNCAVELSDENRSMLVIPPGFGHGFQTLVDNVELIYFHSEHYSPSHEGGVNPLDEQLGIAWPLSVTEISDRDRTLKSISEVTPISNLI